MLSIASPVAADVCAALGFGVFAHEGEGLFRAITPLPSTLSEHWPSLAESLQGGDAVRLSDTFPYLEFFLYDAEGHWASGSPEPLPSGIWNETVGEQPGGEPDIALEATALTQGGQALMLVGEPTVGFERLQDILQSSREQVLDYHHLLKEIDRREVLLHCVVHDLSSPLAGIRGSLTFLKEDDLVAEDGEELLDISLIQAKKLQALVREILDSYTQQTAPLLSGLNTSSAPDLVACAREVTAALAPTAAQQGVTFRVLAETDGSESAEPDWLIPGDLARLERIYFNLLENALRHAPPHSTITVRVSPTDHPELGPCYCTSIEDQGPGVPEAAVPRLFQRFSQGGGTAGKAGLGLYFCRITVQG